MASSIVAKRPSIVLEYKNKQPLDLLDFASALKAFGENYRRNSVQQFGQSGGARLAVGKLETGSVIATLIPLLQAAEWVRGHYDLVGPFVAQFGEYMDLIRSFPPKARQIPKQDVRAVRDVTAPVANDPGAQLNIYGAEGATIITNVYNIGSNGAQDLKKHAGIILAGTAEEITFEAEPMVLHQVRDGPAGAGDYCFIDKFSRTPVRIRWLSEEVKAAVLGRANNIFDFVYFVSGTVKTAGGAVVAYEIRRLDDEALKPPDQRHG